MNPFDVTSILKRILASTRGPTELFFAPGHAPKLASGFQLLHADVKDLKRFTPYQTEVLAFSLLADSPKARAHFLKTGSACFSFVIPKVNFFRVHVLRHLEGISVLFRVIPPVPPTLESLGLLMSLGSHVGKRQGLILVCSPARNGKTTTQAAILNYLNQFNPCHILSVECPVEYRIGPEGPGLIQYLEVQGEESEMLAGLQTGARLGCPAIFCTHLDSPQLLEQALSICDSGGLVVGGLGCGSVAQALSRVQLLLKKPEAMTRFAEHVTSIVCQTLLPNKDGTSSVAAFELLHGNPAVRSFLRSGADPSELPGLFSKYAEEGMQSYMQDVAQLVKHDQVHERELQRYYVAPEKSVRTVQKSGSRDLELDESMGF